MPRRPRDLVLSLAMAAFFVGLIAAGAAFALYASDRRPTALLVTGGLVLMGAAVVAGVGRTAQLARRRDAAKGGDAAPEPAA